MNSWALSQFVFERLRFHSQGSMIRLGSGVGDTRALCISLASTRVLS